MKRKFNVGDKVIQKDIGNTPKKVIRLSEQYDDEAESYLFGTLIKAISTSTNEGIIKESNNTIDVTEHMIYYVTCEWCDYNGVRHEDTIEESKLDLFESLPSRASIGFNKKD